MSDPVTDLTAARRLMVLNQLRPQGVTDARVLAAMGMVPREDHLPANLRDTAYGDRPLRLDSGAPVMPPAELGQLLTRLAPEPGDRALVMGEGGAYSAAVLGAIGLTVATSVDGDKVDGDFDLILIEGAVDHVPPTLLARLAPGGRIGVAIVTDGVTRLAMGRAASNSAGSAAIGLTSFAEAQVPILPGFARAPAFAF